MLLSGPVSSNYYQTFHWELSPGWLFSLVFRTLTVETTRYESTGEALFFVCWGGSQFCGQISCGFPRLREGEVVGG